MARWDNHTEQDKQDTIARKRANQIQKRQTASAGRPRKERKTKQSLITVEENQESNLGRWLPSWEDVLDSALLADHWADFRKIRDAASRGDKARKIAEEGWRGFSPGAHSGIESHTDVSGEMKAELEVKRERAESEEKREQEIEALASQGWDAFLEECNQKINTFFEKQRKLAEAEPELKQRRKAFDAATQKPVRKVKASDDPMEHTKEMIAFLTWLLTQPQKAVSKQSIVEEIARLKKIAPKAESFDC